MRLKLFLSKNSEKFSIPIRKYTLKSEYSGSEVETQKCAESAVNCLKYSLQHTGSPTKPNEMGSLGRGEAAE